MVYRTDRQDSSAVGWEYKPKAEKHASQKGGHSLAIGVHHTVSKLIASGSMWFLF